MTLILQRQIASFLFPGPYSLHSISPQVDSFLWVLSSFRGHPLIATCPKAEFLSLFLEFLHKKCLSHPCLLSLATQALWSTGCINFTTLKKLWPEHKFVSDLHEVQSSIVIDSFITRNEPLWVYGSSRFKIYALFITPFPTPSPGLELTSIHETVPKFRSCKKFVRTWAAVETIHGDISIWIFYDEKNGIHGLPFLIAWTALLANLALP